jgi:PAS domain-containing protein
VPGGGKSLSLILAREFASNVAVPTFLVDPDNTLVYYNEAASVAFGGTFGTTREMRHGEWSPRFNPTDREGRPVPRERLPMVVALEERRPAHGTHLVSAPDGGRVLIELTAVPLYSSPEHFEGVLVVFWLADEQGAGS